MEINFKKIKECGRINLCYIHVLRVFSWLSETQLSLQYLLNVKKILKKYMDIQFILLSAIQGCFLRPRSQNQISAETSVCFDNVLVLMDQS